MDLYKITLLAIFCFIPAAFAAPQLEVTGVFVDPKKGAAIVNHTTVGVGEEIEGATITKVTKEGVMFKYNDEEFFQPIKDPQMYTGAKKVESPAAAAAKPAAANTDPGKPGMPKSILVNGQAVNETLKKIDVIKGVVADRSKMTDQLMDEMQSTNKQNP